MHNCIYQQFERLCANKSFQDAAILEVGAVPHKNSLLCSHITDDAAEKIGLNLDGPYECEDFVIYKGNANSMDMFDNCRFDAVFCNAVIEHDKYFWKTISEIKRVTKPGGTILIGAPGYKTLKLERFQNFVEKLPIFRKLKKRANASMLFKSTITFRVHNTPGDYYRFSEQCFRDIIFEGCRNVEVTSVMLPPRFIGIGEKQ